MNEYTTKSTWVSPAVIITLLLLGFVFCSKKPVSPGEEKVVEVELEYGTLIDERDGQVYKTIQIGNQTWMAENLNVGKFIPASVTTRQMNNGVIEKFAYANDTSWSDSLGGLYQWGEVMQYNEVEGSRGICPFGWHVPTDQEWKTLEIELGMSINEIDQTGPRGDTEGNELLKGGATGFDALYAGYCEYRNETGYWLTVGFTGGGNDWIAAQGEAIFLSSSGYFRGLHVGSGSISRIITGLNFAHCVRCIKDADSLVPAPLLKTNVNSINQTGYYGLDGQVQLIVSNIGTDTLTFSLSTNTEWIDITQLSMTFLAPDASDTVVLGIRSTDFDLNTYTGQVTINSNSLNNRTKNVRVTVNMYDKLVDSRDGRIYRIGEVGDDVWMLDYLNVGSIINSYTSAADNGVIEKYAYDNSEDNAERYGALYQWDEAMGYSEMKGVQGICPDGWHIPTKAEISNSVLSTLRYSGYRYTNGRIIGLGFDDFVAGGIWSSSQDSESDAWAGVISDSPGDVPWSGMSSRSKSTGYCIRCVRGVGANHNSPSIGVSTHEIYHEYFQDTPLADTFYVFNFGSGTINYTVSTSEQWLACDVSSGQSNGEYDRIIIAYEHPLAIGEHNAMLSIAAPEASNTEVLAIKLVSYGRLYDKRDGQNYRTIEVAGQTWMAENLNTGNRIYTTLQQSNNELFEKYAYDNAAANFDIYGGLYQWHEAMAYDTSEGAQGICPYGWHIPSKSDWEQLLTVGGYSYSTLIQGGNLHFDVIFSGIYQSDYGRFDGKARKAYFWTSSNNQDNEAPIALYIEPPYAGWSSTISFSEYSADDAMCIRCIKK